MWTPTPRSPRAARPVPAPWMSPWSPRPGPPRSRAPTSSPTDEVVLLPNPCADAQRRDGLEEHLPPARIHTAKRQVRGSALPVLRTQVGRMWGTGYISHGRSAHENHQRNGFHPLMDKIDYPPFVRNMMRDSMLRA